MEIWQIVVFGCIVPSMAYLFIQYIQHSKQNSVLTAQVDNIMAMCENNAKEIEKLSVRIDMFLKNELDTLKDIAKNLRQ